MATSSKQVGFVLVLCAFSQLPMLGGVFVYLPLDGEAERAGVCARYYIDQHSNPLYAVFYIDDQLHIIIWTQGTIIQHVLAHIGMPPDSAPSHSSLSTKEWKSNIPNYSAFGIGK